VPLSRHPIPGTGTPDVATVEIVQAVLGDDAPIVARLWPSEATRPGGVVDLTDAECDALADVLREVGRQIRHFRQSVDRARALLAA
jgi:hypothetical protein